MHRVRISLIGLLIATVPAAAWADPDPAPSTQPGDEEAPPAAIPTPEPKGPVPSASPTPTPTPAVTPSAPPAPGRSQPPSAAVGGGEDQIPDPDVGKTQLRDVHDAAAAQAGETPRYTKRNYPIELVKRPLTLVAGMAELSLDVPFVLGDGDPLLTQTLRANFGVTDRFQLGLTYSVGLERLSHDPAEDGFVAGKAVSLDGGFTILPGHLAAQLRFGVYADSKEVGFGLVIAAPVRVNFGERWALVGGQELLHFKIKRLAVDAADPAGNVAAVDFQAIGGVPSDGSFNLNVGAIFQAQPNLAMTGTFGLSWPNFSGDHQPVSLYYGLLYSPVRRVDLGARIGFADLSETSQSFTLAVSAAARF